MDLDQSASSAQPRLRPGELFRFVTTPGSYLAGMVAFLVGGVVFLGFAGIVTALILKEEDAPTLVWGFVGFAVLLALLCLRPAYLAWRMSTGRGDDLIVLLVTEHGFVLPGGLEVTWPELRGTWIIRSRHPRSTTTGSPRVEVRLRVHHPGEVRARATSARHRKVVNVFGTASLRLGRLERAEYDRLVEWFREGERRYGVRFRQAVDHG